MAALLGTAGECLSTATGERRAQTSRTQSIIGWSGKIRVDGTTFSWMGQDNIGNGSATITDVQITPTRSIFSMQAGPMNITVTFLSPVEVRTQSSLRAHHMNPLLPGSRMTGSSSRSRSRISPSKQHR